MSRPPSGDVSWNRTWPVADDLGEFGRVTGKGENRLRVAGPERSGAVEIGDQVDIGAAGAQGGVDLEGRPGARHAHLPDQGLGQMCAERPDLAGFTVAPAAIA